VVIPEEQARKYLLTPQSNLYLISRKDPVAIFRSLAATISDSALYLRHPITTAQPPTPPKRKVLVLASIVFAG
jgi:hypothetical protein